MVETVEENSYAVMQFVALSYLKCSLKFPLLKKMTKAHNRWIDQPNEANQETNFISFFFVEGQNELNSTNSSQTYGSAVCIVVWYAGITSVSWWYHIEPDTGHAAPDLCVLSPLVYKPAATSYN